MVEFILTNFNEAIEKINLTLQSICQQGSLCRNIYLVDDGSVNVPLNPAHIYPDERIVLISMPQNMGISACRNQALQRVEAPFVVCMNIEIQLQADWLKHCLAILENHPEVGAVFGGLQPANNNLLSKWRMRFHEIHYHIPSGYVPFAPGHAVMFRTADLRKVGGYNAALKRVHEDAEVCERLNSIGLKVYYENKAWAISHQDDTVENLARKTMIRATWGQYDVISWQAFTKATTKRFVNRFLRNLLKGRWLFLPIDLRIYIKGFQLFFRQKK